jgi:hypothetical protein
MRSVPEEAGAVRRVRPVQEMARRAFDQAGCTARASRAGQGLRLSRA